MASSGRFRASATVSHVWAFWAPPWSSTISGSAVPHRTPHRLPAREWAGGGPPRSPPPSPQRRAPGGVARHQPVGAGHVHARADMGLGPERTAVADAGPGELAADAAKVGGVEQVADAA